MVVPPSGAIATVVRPAPTVTVVDGEAASELVEPMQWQPPDPERSRSTSVVIPARNEAAYLGETLASITELESVTPDEVLVVDGESTDETAEIAREYGAAVVEGTARSIAVDRNVGARRADGEWLVFVDADTAVRPDYLSTMLAFVETNGLAAASSRCRITGPVRAKLMEATINHVFPRLDRPVLPGFNLMVHREPFEAVGGFPDVPNEDTAFSRRLGAEFPTGYCPTALVESSGRRIAERGLTGTLWHYVKLDVERIRATMGRERSPSGNDR